MEKEKSDLDNIKENIAECDDINYINKYIPKCIFDKGLYKKISLTIAPDKVINEKCKNLAGTQFTIFNRNKDNIPMYNRKYNTYKSKKNFIDFVNDNQLDITDENTKNVTYSCLYNKYINNKDEFNREMEYYKDMKVKQKEKEEKEQQYFIDELTAIIPYKEINKLNKDQKKELTITLRDDNAIGIINSVITEPEQKKEIKLSDTSEAKREEEQEREEIEEEPEKLSREYIDKLDRIIELLEKLIQLLEELTKDV